MKRLLISLLAVTMLTMFSCKKDDPEEDVAKNPAEAFVGEYTVSTDVSITYTIPMVGPKTITRPLDDMDITIELNGTKGAVKIIALNKSVDGTVDKDGLHVESQTITMPIETVPVELSFSFPTIKAPVNGVTSWKANVNGKVTYNGLQLTATGVADQTATKK